MKLTCMQEDLKQGLNTVAPALSKRVTLPVLNNVMLATEGGRLKLTAYNLEFGITCWIGAKVAEEGSITLPGLLLIDFISSLDEGLTEISILPKTHRVEIIHKRQRTRISGVDAKDYPPMPTVKDGRLLMFDPAGLREALDYSHIAASHEYSRPVLVGVNLRVKDHTEATFAGADGFRLSTYKLTLVNRLDQPLDVNIPLDAVTKMVGLLADVTEPVELFVGVKQRVVLLRVSRQAVKDIELVSTLLDGNFPNYEGVIPQEFERKVTLKADEFATAVRLSAIVSRSSEGIVRMQTSSGVALVSSRTEEEGDTQNYVAAALVGDEGKIAFREKYMREVLDRAGESEVIMQTSGPSSPIVLRIPGKESFCYTLMPTFVQW